MKRMRRVRQRFRSDCGVACVAMVAGVGYREAFDAFGFVEGERHFYTNHGQLVRALEVLGCTVERRKFTSWENIPGRAILPVNHRCNRRNFHWVVFDGRAVRDPNPEREPQVKDFKRYRASGWYLLSV